MTVFRGKENIIIVFGREIFMFGISVLSYPQTMSKDVFIGGGERTDFAVAKVIIPDSQCLDTTQQFQITIF